MARILFAWLRILGVGLAVQAAIAQKCYYPNGKEAPEKPCSSADGSACCPDKWQCLDNGLCHYEADDLYGAYSCTDQSWKAPGCPSNLCTYDMNRPGGESITQCSDHDNQWCCNADATHVNCCRESPEPRPFFDLAEGKAYATVGAMTASEAPNLASVTGLASGSSGSSPSSKPSSSDEPKSSSPPSSADSSADSSPSSATPTGPTTPVTSLETRVSSGTAGPATVVVTVVSQPPVESSTDTPSPSSPQESKSKLPIIVGCAVGIPLGLALLGILFWLFRKRHTQKKNAHPYSETPDPYTNGNASPEFAGGAKLTKNGATKYKSEAEHIPELAGQSVGPGRPISTIKGRAELDSGSGFQPGATPQAPHLVGVGGGNAIAHSPQASWGSAPPGYSPATNQNAWAPGHGHNVSVGSVGDGAGAAQQTDGGRYIPYRPPPGHDAAMGGAGGGGRGGLQNVPEMAELSAVRTPP